MEASRYRVALIAADFSEEPAPIREIVAAELSGWDLREFDHLRDFIAAAEEFSPDITIVCQGWRDQFGSAEIGSAFSRFPLSRWICVYGSWCESEGRHGSRWALAVRVPVRSFRTRLLGEAAVVAGKRAALPITADREEVFEFDALTKFTERPAGRDTAAAISPDPEFRAWLKDILQEAGFETIGERPIENPDLVVIDLDPLRGQSLGRVESLRQKNPQARIVALRDSVEEGRDDEIQAAGADLILPKLTPTAELAFALQGAPGQD